VDTILFYGIVSHFRSVNNLPFLWITRFTIRIINQNFQVYSRIIRILITARYRTCIAWTAKSFWFLFQVRFICARKRAFLKICFVPFCRYDLLYLGEGEIHCV